jgi:hypothetical protein
MTKKKCKQCKALFSRIIVFVNGTCPNCYLSNVTFSSKYNDFEAWR